MGFRTPVGSKLMLSFSYPSFPTHLLSKIPVQTQKATQVRGKPRFYPFSQHPLSRRQENIVPARWLFRERPDPTSPRVPVQGPRRRPRPLGRSPLSGKAEHPLRLRLAARPLGLGPSPVSLEKARRSPRVPQTRPAPHPWVSLLAAPHPAALTRCPAGA